MHEGVPDLVELAGQLGVPAVLDALPVHMELAPPFAVVVTLPAEVEARPRGGTRCRSGPPARTARTEPSSMVTATSPPSSRRLAGSNGQVGPDVGHPLDPAVEVFDGPGHRAVPGDRSR